MALDRACIDAPNAPTPIAYSHAVRMGQLLFVSGQLPVDSERRLVALGYLTVHASFAGDRPS